MLLCCWSPWIARGETLKLDAKARYVTDCTGRGEFANVFSIELSLLFFSSNSIINNFIPQITSILFFNEERMIALLLELAPVELDLQLLNSLILLAFHHPAQRTLLDHQAHDFIQSICSSHGRVLGISIVCRSNFHNICCNQVDAFQSPKNSTEFTRRPSSCLGSSSCWCDLTVLARRYKPKNILTCWVECIDVNG